MAEAQMKKAKEVMKAPEVKSLLKTAGIKTSQRPYLQGRILGWMKRGQGMPALKANLCKLLIKGLRNARPMLPTQKAKDKADIAIGKLRFKLTQISREATQPKRAIAQAPIPKPLLTKADFRAMELGAKDPKRKMRIWGKVTLVREPESETKRRVIVSKGKLTIFTNAESEILGKLGPQVPGTDLPRLLKTFNKDVAAVAAGKHIKASEPGERYARTVNNYGKKVAALIRKQKGAVTKTNAANALVRIVRNEIKIAQAVAKGPDIKASKEREAPPIDSYTYTFTARSREKYGRGAGKPVTFTINSKKPLGRLSLLTQESLARAGVTVVKGNRDKFTAVVNDPHFYDTQLTLVSTNYAKRKRS